MPYLCRESFNKRCVIVAQMLAVTIQGRAFELLVCARKECSGGNQNLGAYCQISYASGSRVRLPQNDAGGPKHVNCSHRGTKAGTLEPALRVLSVTHRLHLIR